MSDYTPIEGRAVKRKLYKDDPVSVEWNEVLGHEAAMAAAFVERWGMVAAMTDGEDTAGRQKLRLATPEEVVERALRTSELLFARAREMGWTVKIPLTLRAVEEDGKQTG